MIRTWIVLVALLLSPGIAPAATITAADAPLEHIVALVVAAVAPALSRLLTLQATSELLGLPVSSVRDLLSRGVLSTVRPPGSRRIYCRRDEVEQAVDRWTERAS